MSQSAAFDIESQRLTGRPTCAADFDLLCQLLQDPQVAATLGGVRGDDEVREFLAIHLAHWDHHGFGRWMWFTKPLSPGGTAGGEGECRFVGRGGLYHVLVDDKDEVELGYALVPEFWGQGLATEIARASIEVAFTRLGLPEIISLTMPNNQASRRVMEKCGFIYERALAWKDVPHVLYRLKR